MHKKSQPFENTFYVVGQANMIKLSKSWRDLGVEVAWMVHHYFVNTNLCLVELGSDDILIPSLFY